jgi:hypothetical protein
MELALKVHKLRYQTPIPAVQCEDICREWQGWSQHYVERRRAKLARLGWKEDHCGKPATYFFNGKHLCTQHASMSALRICIEQSRSEDG